MIYFICGMTLSGKSTIADIISAKTRIKHLDKDQNIRAMLFGNAGVAENTTSDVHDSKIVIFYQITAFAEIW